MKIVQVNDIHLASNPPAGRQPSYEADILAKLTWVVEHSNYIEADLIVCTGDILHSKNASHTTHLLVQKIRDILHGFDGDVLIVVGNHDERHGGGTAGQPILSLLGDNVRLLYGDDPEWPVCGIPWDNRMEGDDGAAFMAGEIAACSAPLVFTHAPLTPTPYPFGSEERGWIESDRLSPLLRDDVRFLGHGHFHDGHVPLITRGITFSNPGALSRASRSEKDIARAPMVADIEYDDITGAVIVQYVEVPHRPASEVLRIAEHARATHRDGSVEALAAHLGSADTEVVDAETMRAHLRGLVRPETIAPDVWDRGMKMADAALDGVQA